MFLTCIRKAKQLINLQTFVSSVVREVVYLYFRYLAKQEKLNYFNLPGGYFHGI